MTIVIIAGAGPIRELADDVGRGGRREGCITTIMIIIVRIVRTILIITLVIIIVIIMIIIIVIIILLITSIAGRIRELADGRRGAGCVLLLLSSVRPVRLLRVWISEGLTQADS